MTEAVAVVAAAVAAAVAASLVRFSFTQFLSPFCVLSRVPLYPLAAEQTLKVGLVKNVFERKSLLTTSQVIILVQYE